MNLGDDYILIRISGNVTVEDFRRGEGGGIPHEIVRFGFNDKFIVSSVVNSQGTNVWIINKEARIVSGPLGVDTFRAQILTNRELAAVTLQNVWDL